MLNIVKGLKSSYKKKSQNVRICVSAKMHAGGPSQFTISRLVLFLSALCGRGEAWFEPVVM